MEGLKATAPLHFGEVPQNLVGVDRGVQIRRQSTQTHEIFNSRRFVRSRFRLFWGVMPVFLSEGEQKNVSLSAYRSANIRKCHSRSNGRHELQSDHSQNQLHWMIIPGFICVWNVRVDFGWIIREEHLRLKDQNELWDEHSEYHLRLKVEMNFGKKLRNDHEWSVWTLEWYTRVAFVFERVNYTL